MVYKRRRLTLVAVVVVILLLVVVACAPKGSGGNPDSEKEAGVAQSSTQSADSQVVKPLDNDNKTGLKMDVICVDAQHILVGTYKQGIIGKCGGPNATVPIASVTKTITALVILDNKPVEKLINEDIVIDDAAMADLAHSESERGTSLVVALGEHINKATAITGMMHQSANNIADTLARQEFGSLENYKKRAQEFLVNHNLTGTVLGNDASGLDDQTRSTVEDLFAIGKLVVDNEALSKVVAEPESEFPNAYYWDEGKTEIISNATHVLVEDAGFNGVKVGYTDDAGSCLLFTKSIAGGDTIIGVTLGDHNVNNSLTRTDTAFPEAKKYGLALEEMLKEK
ncbi:hypothetical protein FACS1894125_4220 [Actinomycetota bacterium]|nr:hypothetical protein FACS1894125_4220 [Actinomycetota bacterium]